MKALFLIAFTYFADKDLLPYREMPVQAEKNAAVSEAFYERPGRPGLPKSPVLEGYKAMSAFMMSKRLTFPVKKLNYFSGGKALLEGAIQHDTASIEPVCLRFSAPSHLPSFPGYRSSLETDKSKLLAFLQKNNSADHDLSNRIFNFMRQAGYTAAGKMNR